MRLQGAGVCVYVCVCGVGVACWRQRALPGGRRGAAFRVSSDFGVSERKSECVCESERERVRVCERKRVGACACAG